MTIYTQQSIFSELADFIVSQPKLEEIAAYRVPEAIQQRMDDLLDKNREEGLIPEEREEMENYLAMSHLMTLAKAKARMRLAGQS